MMATEVVALIVAPLALSLLVATIHRREARIYWGVLSGVVIAAGLLIAVRTFRGGSFVNSPVVTGLVFFILPTMATFFIGRLELLRGRPFLVLLLSLVTYLLVVWLALAAAVTAGFLQP